ncbi:IS1595 family transposase [Oceanirhabdus seepicola]|uniref:IS1595 family transposase n=1 Tax=Oceanirhabdus seepicola TaxID=2828781 RepID=A0A9J6P8S1_9CLOT|nr:IS1595 family transposase [Oceanirhabdus seepicola]MCM1992398.1 IS1595 family transposase [Oceanirhabdus seepicola]
MTDFFTSNINGNLNDQKRDYDKHVSEEKSKDNPKENNQGDYKDEFLDEFEKNVLESNFLPEIEANLLKLVNRARGSETKKYEENRMKEQERICREEKRLNKLIILEKVIKEIDSKKNSNNNQEIIEGIREQRFKESRVCPHCGYKKIWKYGKYDGKQRYRCKSDGCGKTFSDRTLSPMYYSKKGIEKWSEYMKCMVRGLSLSECSYIVGINIATAFYWRHKIMDGLRENMGSGFVGGIVECGHMVVVESIKGNSNKKGKYGVFNRGRRCGIKDKYTLILDEEKPKANYVVCAVDRKGNMVVEACNRRVDKRLLGNIFYGKILCGTILCTEGNRHYHQFAQEMELTLGRGCTGDDNEEYHIGNLMGMKREIINWLSSFNGVSSKYLTNYLYWYRWMKGKKLYNGKAGGCNDVSNYDGNVGTCNDDHSAAKSMFLESHTKYTGMIIMKFKERKPIYVAA